MSANDESFLISKNFAKELLRLLEDIETTHTDFKNLTDSFATSLSLIAQGRTMPPVVFESHLTLLRTRSDVLEFRLASSRSARQTLKDLMHLDLDSSLKNA